VADGNNPLPRDRFILDYDYFNSVTLTPNNFNVNRVAVGFEKTFLCQRASVEVRVPFASTLSNDVLADGTTGTRTQFGNVNVALKFLALHGDTHNLSVGMAVDLPTGNDTSAFAGATEQVRIKNDNMILTPFVAWLYTPDDCFFFQNWYSFDCNTKRNPVLVNDGVSLLDMGHLREQSLFQIDAQLGFWILGPRECGFLRGMAPYAELHYNTTVGKPINFTIPALSLTYPQSRFEELNLALGTTFLLGDRVNVTAGAAFPLLGLTPIHHSFDFQIGVRGTIYFGPTYQSRTASSLLSAF
jgi:hypothetical protein